MFRIHQILVVGLATGGLLAGSVLGGALPTTVDFESGNEGWVLNGWDIPDSPGGNPGAHLHWANFVDTFGMEARTDSNAAFIGDYTSRGSVRLSIDVQVNFIQFFGQEVTRDLTLQLRDYDGGSVPATLWTPLGTLTSSKPGWVTFTADITDVLSPTMPAGWFGSGDEDPVTFEPRLPLDRTWTDVLSGIDEIAFSTFVPGYFFGFTNFDLSVDNVRIEAVPTPGVGGAIVGALALCGVLRRRR